MKIYTILICLIIAFFSHAQQTVGLFTNTSQSCNGYTLFSNNKTSYLINNCGFVVNSWESDFRPGLSLYLLENGNLLRTAKINGIFSGGGIGGRFELFNWDGNMIWSYEYASGSYHAHHDIEPLPNGNFLAICWEKYTQSEAQQNGRKYNGDVWSEKIIEIEIIGNNQANIVWEWRLWDHLVQDHDSNKLNYGDIAAHPALIDINYIGEGEETDGDWAHVNAVAYNQNLDQIVLSSRNFSEIWIIDHSTTTAEAASHIGGDSGKGGDILYRYGNPQAYKRGGSADQVFFKQHDVKWIPEGFPNENKMMVFNNIYVPNSSSVEIWEPPLQNKGLYILENDEAYGPAEIFWQYSSPGFYSKNISGAQALANGNVLICEGDDGFFFEVTAEKEIVWEYINPVNQNGFPVSQGGTPQFNDTFRATRYGTDYQAFIGKDLSPGLPVEINPDPIDCEIYDSPVDVGDVSIFLKIKIIGNPVSDILTIYSEIFSGKIYLNIVDLYGREIGRYNILNGENIIDLFGIIEGVYFAKFSNGKEMFETEIIIKI